MVLYGSCSKLSGEKEMEFTCVLIKSDLFFLRLRFSKGVLRTPDPVSLKTLALDIELSTLLS